MLLLRLAALGRKGRIKQVAASLEGSRLGHSVASSRSLYAPHGQQHIAPSYRIAPSHAGHQEGHERYISSVFLFGSGRSNADTDADAPVDLVERAENALNSRLESTGTASTDDFLTVFRTLVDSRLPNAPLKAERWLRRMEQLEGVPITSECYQRVIEAWAAAGNEDPARKVTRAETWLQKAQNIPDDAHKANTACFNAFLDICTRGNSSRRGDSLTREHVEMADRALHHMIRERQRDGSTCRMAPNTESFNLVIRGWTRCRSKIEMADRAFQTLHLLEQYSAEIDSRVEPDARTYRLLMYALALRAKSKVKQLLERPDGHVLDPNKRLLERQSGNLLDPTQNGLQEIQLIRSMIELIHQKRHSLEPDGASNSTYHYNILLSCWANISALHPNATAEAEQVLSHMVALQARDQAEAGPDAISYVTTMRAWCNSAKPNKGERVTWLLSKQWRDYEFSGNELLRPTTMSYNMCLRVWSDLENPLEADKILHEMTRLSKDIYGDTLKPDSASFGYVVRAWLKLANRGSEKALMEAHIWIDKLMELERKEGGVLSSEEHFHLFLSAARFCAPHYQDALGMCFHVFDQLRKSRHTLDQLHYTRLLEVALSALPDKDDDEVRHVILEKIISECKEDGLVSKNLVKALSNGPVRSSDAEGWTVEASRNAILQHFPTWPLPAAWTRNLRSAEHQPQQSDLQRFNSSSRFCIQGPKRRWHRSERGH